MAKKMISALKEVVGESVEFEERKGRIESVLMNGNRFAIFQFLCIVPGSSISTLSEVIRLSTSSIKWHLEILKGERYVVESTAGNRLAYFPKGMIDDQFMEVLCVLNEHLPVTIFWMLLKTPGLSQKELCNSLNEREQPLRSALKKLERSNLILSVVDGRYRRYYPTDELYTLASRNRKSLRQFKANLLKRFDAELLNPRMNLSKRRESVVEVNAGSVKNSLRIPSDLPASVISHYVEKSPRGKEV